ncbi:MAG TPA: hypothetical protein VG125_31360 [Pirellulales bacterium]|jgi:hypothetical protein|nr:hypothetical protein [Pirellulales bacterium]
MHPRLQPAILGGALAALLVLVRTSAAHFVLIYPEADDDQPALTTDAAWLRPPSKTARSDSSASKAKKLKPLPQAKEKSHARVPPLKRERPKRETDPPKTRRRQLGW